MPSADLVLPTRMSRVAVVAPRARRAGGARRRSPRPASSSSSGNLPPPRERRSRRCGVSVERAAAGGRAGACSHRPPDLAALESAGRERPARRRGRARRGVPAWPFAHGSFVALGRLGADGRGSSPRTTGWRRIGAAVVELSRPAWVEPPTLLQPGRWSSRSGRSSRPTGRRRYGDLDPTRVHRRLVRRHVRDHVRRRRSRPRARAARRCWLRRRSAGASPPSSGSGRFPFAAGPRGDVLRAALR